MTYVLLDYTVTVMTAMVLFCLGWFSRGDGKSILTVRYVYLLFFVVGCGHWLIDNASE
jgi:hypothetical protein